MRPWTCSTISRARRPDRDHFAPLASRVARPPAAATRGGTTPGQHGGDATGGTVGIEGKTRRGRKRSRREDAAEAQEFALVELATSPSVGASRTLRRRFRRHGRAVTGAPAGRRRSKGRRCRSHLLALDPLFRPSRAEWTIIYRRGEWPVLMERRSAEARWCWPPTHILRATKPCQRTMPALLPG